MTLRHRLLTVYIIVVLLSAATVGVAVFELRNARQIIRELQDWNQIAQFVDKLKYSFRLPAAGIPSEEPFEELFPRQYRELGQAPEYLNVDKVRKAINQVQLQYQAWRRLDSEERQERIGMVRTAMDDLALAVQGELANLNSEAVKQDYRTMVLLGAVITLTIIHVGVIGSLLRRWLLQPMERLGRQVDALARDQGPGEPLLDEPAEMAHLAQALDRARRSLADLRRKLIEGERLTTIGQFAAQLAHNLRNPLSSIRASAQLAAKESGTDDAMKQRMHDIMEAVDRLNRWISGLSEVIRREATPACHADVVSVMRRVVEGVRQEASGKELQVLLEAPSEGLVCPHNPETLEHALVAVIVNAIEASPLGGTITMSAERVSVDGFERERARITVEDQGSGLPEDEPQRIFDSSFSTKPLGMGLGLALARVGLERDGGRVGAMNRPEGGAAVWIDLPLSSPGGGNDASTLSSPVDRGSSEATRSGDASTA